MGFSITEVEAKGIEVDYIFKLDTLGSHLEECISTITPVIDCLPNFKHIYTPNNISSYYNVLKRKYEANKSAWINRGKLWQIN